MVKRIISIALTVFLSIFVTCTSFAAETDIQYSTKTLFNENFDEKVSGDFKLTENTQIGAFQWIIDKDSDKNGNGAFTENIGDNVTNAMVLKPSISNTASRPILKTSVSGFEDQLVLKFSFFAATLATSLRINLKGTTLTAAEGMDVAFENGKLYYGYYSNTTKIDSGATYKIGEWNTAELIFNIDTATQIKTVNNVDYYTGCTYSGYINDSLAFKNAVDTNAVFGKTSLPAAVHSFGAMQLVCNIAPDSYLAFDNIECYNYNFEEAEIIANEVGLTSDTYVVNDDDHTVGIPRGISKDDFLNEIKDGVKGKIVSLKTADGEIPEILSNNCVLNLVSLNGLNELQYRLEIINLPPTVQIMLSSETDVNDFSPIRVKANDDDSVTSVELFVNNTSLGIQSTEEHGYYTYLYTPTYFGKHTVKAVAYDNEGKSGIDEVITGVYSTVTNQGLSLDFETPFDQPPFTASGGLTNSGNEDMAFGKFSEVGTNETACFGATVSKNSGRGTNGSWVSVDGMKANTKARLRYDFFLSADSLTQCLNVYDKSNGSIGNGIAQVANGKLVYFNNGVQAGEIALEPMNWYTLTNTVSLDKYSFTLADSAGTIIAEQTDLNLKTAMKYMTHFYLHFGGGVDGIIYIDNLDYKVFSPKPYIAGVSNDLENIADTLDYTAKSFNVSIPTGFVLPFDTENLIRLSAKNGAIKIKSLTQSADGKWLTFETDYRSDRGLEPSTEYTLTLSDKVLMMDGETENGSESIGTFITKAAPFGVNTVSFDDEYGTVDFVNTGAENREVYVVITPYSNGIPTSAKVYKTTVTRSGTKNFLLPHGDGYTLAVLDLNLKPVDNRIFCYNLPQPEGAADNGTGKYVTYDSKAGTVQVTSKLNTIYNQLVTCMITSDTSENADVLSPDTLIACSITGENGSVSNTVAIPSTLSSSIYHAYLYGTDDTVLDTGDFKYINFEAVKQLLPTIISAENADAIKTLLKNNADVLVLDDTLSDQFLTTLSEHIYKYVKLNGTSAISVDDFIADYNTAYAITEIKSGSDIAAVLQQYSAYFGIDPINDYIALPQETKQYLNGLLLSADFGVADVPALYNGLKIYAQIKTAKIYQDVQTIIEKPETFLFIDPDTTYYNKITDKSEIYKEFLNFIDSVRSFDEIAPTLEKASENVFNNAKSTTVTKGGSSGGGNSTGKITAPNNAESYVAAAKLSFSDISDHWAKNEIEALVLKGIISGYEDKTFKPDGSITRAEFVKLIVNAFGITTDANASFVDVAKEDWYYPYVSAAIVSGIANGISDEYFAPQSAITRQDASVILYRALEKGGASFAGAMTDFSDESTVSAYAEQAVKALASKNIINGFGDGSFRPNSNITRAEAAAILMRCF